ncbi:MAG: hypothetical protein FJZ00_11260 [Candidatus Sericytochromatia bacterium]|uniref:Uncharacterized protein n=1 Tax=Candidatus Tanganyikabacteria bacterium TaxID=2961651 RepID=A0A937X4K5_9BACT|nr:hypothetical protein [Candidatus Tanganyikabacteria bacterium]
MKIVKVDGEPVDETPSQFIARLRTDPAAFLHRIEARPSGIPPRERVATSVHLVESREFPSGDFAVAFMFLLFTFPLIGAAFMSLLIEPGKLFKDRPELHLPTTWFGLALSVIGLAMTLENLAVDVPGLYQAAMGGAFLAGWGVTRAFLFRKSMAEWRLADKIAFAAIALFTAMAMTPDLAAAWAGGT